MNFWLRFSTITPRKCHSILSIPNLTFTNPFDKTKLFFSLNRQTYLEKVTRTNRKESCSNHSHFKYDAVLQVATFSVAMASRKNNCNQNCQEGCQFGNLFPHHLTSLDVHPEITETHNHKARRSYLKMCKGMKEENKNY